MKKPRSSAAPACGFELVPWQLCGSGGPNDGGYRRFLASKYCGSIYGRGTPLSPEPYARLRLEFLEGLLGIGSQLGVSDFGVDGI